jgi:Polyketide cyclase / dehydrase and lipid transport
VAHDRDMAKLSYEIESNVPPEVVLEAATDFGPRRLELWAGIDPSRYELHGAGEGWADVTEASAVFGGIWARERYTWSGNTVVATVQESNVFRPGGTWRLTVEPNGSGGSTIRVSVHRRAGSLRGRMLGAVVQVMGRKVLRASFETTLGRLGGTSGAQPGSEIPPPGVEASA